MIQIVGGTIAKRKRLWVSMVCRISIEQFSMVYWSQEHCIFLHGLVWVFGLSWLILHINDVNTDLDPTASHSYMKIVAILLYLINTSAIIPMLDIISQLSVRDSAKGFPGIVPYRSLFLRESYLLSSSSSSREASMQLHTMKKLLPQSTTGVILACKWVPLAQWIASSEHPRKILSKWFQYI